MCVSLGLLLLVPLAACSSSQTSRSNESMATELSECAIPGSAKFVDPESLGASLAGADSDQESSSQTAEAITPCSEADLSGPYGSFDTPPEIIREVAPTALERAKALGEEGVVQVLLEIGRSGHVCNVRTMRTTVTDELTESALEAALQWRFTPAFRDGEPVRSRVVVPFRYGPASEEPDSVGAPAGVDYDVFRGKPGPKLR